MVGFSSSPILQMLQKQFGVLEEICVRVTGCLGNPRGLMRTPIPVVCWFSAVYLLTVRNVTGR